jgi:hypothetical protein
MASWRTHPGGGGSGATGTGHGGGGGGGSVGSADSVANMDDFLSGSDSLDGGEAADSADGGGGGVGPPSAEQRGKLAQRVAQTKLRPTATMVLSRGADGMPKMVPATKTAGGGGGEVNWGGPVRGGWMQARPPSVGDACSRLALFVQPASLFPSSACLKTLIVLHRCL